MFIPWLFGFSRISRNSAGDGTGSVTAPPASRVLSLLQRLGFSTNLELTINMRLHLQDDKSCRQFVHHLLCADNWGITSEVIQ